MCQQQCLHLALLQRYLLPPPLRSALVVVVVFVMVVVVVVVLLLTRPACWWNYLGLASQLPYLHLCCQVQSSHWLAWP
jgi:hypothetical protein